MRDAAHSLRRLPIALQFGVKLDLDVAEEEIDRQMTLSAGASQDAAMARFAIARTKPPKESAEYVQKHRQQLAKHLNPSFLAAAEIDALVESGQLQLAEERIEQLIEQDVPLQERQRLVRIVAEARESDPIDFREKQFAATDELGELAVLVEAPEGTKDWSRLAKYAVILFERTRDLPICARISHRLPNGRRRRRYCGIRSTPGALDFVTF